MTALADIAVTHLSRADRDGAIRALSAAQDADDYNALGMACLDGNLWGAAYAALRKAMSFGEPSPALALNLALAEDRLALDGRNRMRSVLTACPDWDEPALRLAESLRRDGATTAAIAFYEQALERRPDRLESLLGLSALLIGTGEARRAQMILVRRCGMAAPQADVWTLLGVACMATGEAKLAEAAFTEAYRLQPGNATIALRRIEAAIAAETADAELARLEIATDRDPLDVAQLTARGILLDRMGRAADAVDVLEAAVALAPQATLPAAAFAAAQIHAGRYVQAIPALRRAADLAPENLSIKNDLAAALNRVHRYREGQEILEQLIKEHGERPAFLCNLAVALVSLGMQHEGVDLAERATSIAPESNLGWRTLCNALAYAPGTTAAGLLEVCRQAARTLPRGDVSPPPQPTHPGRRLRIGLLSMNLRTHPVGWLTIAGFESLDPAQFDIVCFGQKPGDDAVQRRFRAVSSEWHDINGWSHRRIAEAVRDAQVDELIDLGGWGDQGLLGVCAYRPAPIQIKWVGMQNHSTGLPEMDWMISDRWETPAGSQSGYSEHLLRMPDGYVCYSPPPDAPDVSALPAGASNRITFGCFNNLAKITPHVIARWSSILRQVPASRLILKTHQFADRQTVESLQRRFALHGIDPARIECRGSSGHRSQLAQHCDIDIMLDPFPYSGGLTTCEALWMGVPVVSVPGEIFASRHSMSHLCNVGLPEWVAADERDYEEIAVSRARDIAGLGRLRADLRERMKASPLCDNKRFGRNLGAVLRTLWRDGCAT